MQLFEFKREKIRGGESEADDKRFKMFLYLPVSIRNTLFSYALTR